MDGEGIAGLRKGGVFDKKEKKERGGVACTLGKFQEAFGSTDQSLTLSVGLYYWVHIIGTCNMIGYRIGHTDGGCTG